MLALEYSDIEPVDLLAIGIVDFVWIGRVEQAALVGLQAGAYHFTEVANNNNSEIHIR